LDCKFFLCIAVAGFFLPKFTGGINVQGYYLHFISAERKKGGHILDFTIAENITATFDSTPSFEMSLTTQGAFAGADRTRDMTGDLAKVER
jgi:acetolactate decarboxylase